MDLVTGLVVLLVALLAIGGAVEVSKHWARVFELKYEAEIAKADAAFREEQQTEPATEGVRRF